MISEWMKVMLEEIARKKADSEQAEAEERLRSREQGGNPAPDAAGDGAGGDGAPSGKAHA